MLLASQYCFKNIIRYKHIGYNLNIMRQSACSVINRIMADNYAAFFNCTSVGRAPDSMMTPALKIKYKCVQKW